MTLLVLLFSWTIMTAPGTSPMVATDGVSYQGVDALVTVQVDQIPAASGQEVTHGIAFVFGEDAGQAVYYFVEQVFRYNTVQLQLERIDDSCRHSCAIAYVTKADRTLLPHALEPMDIRAEILSDGTLHARMWLASLPEPSTWLAVQLVPVQASYQVDLVATTSKSCSFSPTHTFTNEENTAA